MITVQRRPKPKERPRGSCIRCARRRLKPMMRMYTPEATLEFEKAVADAYRAAGGLTHAEPVALIVGVEETGVTFEVVPIPSVSKLRGDVDNYVKAVSDGLNKVAYADDKLVHLVIGGKGTAGRSVERWAGLLRSGFEAVQPDGEGEGGQADSSGSKVGRVRIPKAARGGTKTTGRSRKAPKG